MSRDPEKSGSTGFVAQIQLANPNTSPSHLTKWNRALKIITKLPLMMRHQYPLPAIPLTFGSSYKPHKSW